MLSCSHGIMSECRFQDALMLQDIFIDMPEIVVQRDTLLAELVVDAPVGLAQAG